MIFEKPLEMKHVGNVALVKKDEESKWRHCSSFSIPPKTVFQFLNSSAFGSAHSTLHHLVIIFCVALVSQFKSTKPSGICKMLQIYPIIHSLYRTAWDTPTKNRRGKQKKLPPGLTPFDPCSSSFGHQLCQATQAADGLDDGVAWGGWGDWICGYRRSVGLKAQQGIAFNINEKINFAKSMNGKK